MDKWYVLITKHVLDAYVVIILWSCNQIGCVWIPDIPLSSSTTLKNLVSVLNVSVLKVGIIITTVFTFLVEVAYCET